MSMADVYCRVNRARGLELLSPEDLMAACRLMSSLNLGLCLRTFDSGATVLQLSDHNDSLIVESTAIAVSTKFQYCLHSSDVFFSLMGSKFHNLKLFCFYYSLKNMDHSLLLNWLKV